ncbi:MAG: PBP1A family penicillin-binding protein [Symploca sp. SIO2E9]|nr:PBP1A family penicillin-binding protein [Symploca sp. SIO2E9]
MSKFIPNNNNISSQLNSGVSKALESESASKSNAQHNQKKQPRAHFLLLRRCREGTELTLGKLKSFSSKIVERFGGSKQLYHRYWFWLGLGVTGGAIALGWGAYALERNLPDSATDVLSYIRDDTITIKASDGEIIQQTGSATRETLKIWEIPEPLIQAFIAIEDRRFEKHHGVDFQGIARAAISNLMAREIVEGGSTITQQLARIVYFDQERSFGRKLKEMRMAQKIEHDLEKEQVIERYLNLVYLGSGAYGIADAAWVYFSKPVSELTLPEMAMLAGLPPAPSVYSPFVNEKAAKNRRDLVLERMQRDGQITEAQMKEAIATPLNTKRSNPKRLEREAYYFTEYIQQELPKYVPPETLGKKGLIIETTLNLDWQDAAEAAVDKTIKNSGRYQRFGQAALVAIDPRSGQIKAMVGGKDFQDLESNNYLNRVTQTKRQPGSTFKTFVYTAAVSAGISPNRGYLDAPYIVDGYEPKNYSDNFRGWISIRQALIKSINVVALKSLIDIGWEPTIEIAKKMGIESKLYSTYSLALGASEVNLLELTSAYGTLAAQGIHTKPHGIDRILDHQGNVIYEEKIQHRRALDEETAAITTWMLRGVVSSGTGRAARIGRPVAGKTGTTDEARDLWFIGYIPQLVAGVWLGNDDNKPTRGSSGTAASTWRQFMAEAIEDLETEPFPERPSKIEGREAVIKAKPIKPKRVLHKKYPKSKSATKSRSRSRRAASTTTRRRRRSVSSQRKPTRPVSRQVRQNKAPRNTAPRRSAPVRTAPKPAPRRQSAPVRPAPKPAPPVRQPAPVPAPRVEKPSKPSPVVAPPAPPAARKAPAPTTTAPVTPPEAPASRSGD